MREIIISVRKVVDAEESFVDGPQRSRRQQGRGRGIGIGIGRGRSVGTGGETRRSYRARDEDKRLLKGWSEGEEDLHVPGEREVE